MEDSIRFFLSQIVIEKMELTGRLKQIAYLMDFDTDLDLNKEIDLVLVRLNYLEKLEKDIRKLNK